MSFNEAVGLRIKQLIEEKKTTQFALSQKIGMTLLTINRMIRNKIHTVKISNLLPILRGLDVTLGEFFTSPIFDGIRED